MTKTWPATHSLVMEGKTIEWTRTPMHLGKRNDHQLFTIQPQDVTYRLIVLALGFCVLGGFSGHRTDPAANR